MSVYSADTINEIDDLKEILDSAREVSDLIPVLKKVQDRKNYIPKGVVLFLSDKLGIPVSKIYGVITFYNYFNLDKKGRFVIAVCEGTACHIGGSSEILRAVKDVLGIVPGEITNDGKFSLEIVRCLGLCSFGPVMMINENEYTKLNYDKVREILEGFLNGENNN